MLEPHVRRTVIVLSNVSLVRAYSKAPPERIRGIIARFKSYVVEPDPELQLENESFASENPEIREFMENPLMQPHP